MSAPRFASRLRGVVSGLLTAALAVAAHTAAGAGLPSGPAVAQLAVVAGTVGAVVATARRGAETPTLMALLAVGQFVGHVVLAAGGHHHAPSSARSTAVMLAAHLVAIAVGAVLIAAGDRLCRAVSRALRRARRIMQVATAPARTVARRPEQPLRSALLLAASLSHRGPPVSSAC